MIAKLFAGYCAAIVLGLAALNHQGTVLMSAFGGQQTADKSVNRYHK